MKTSEIEKRGDDEAHTDVWYWSGRWRDGESKLTLSGQGVETQPGPSSVEQCSASVDVAGDIDMKGSGKQPSDDSIEEVVKPLTIGLINIAGGGQAQT